MTIFYTVYGTAFRKSQILKCIELHSENFKSLSVLSTSKPLSKEKVLDIMNNPVECLTRDSSKNDTSDDS